MLRLCCRAASHILPQKEMDWGAHAGSAATFVIVRINKTDFQEIRALQDCH